MLENLCSDRMQQIRILRRIYTFFFFTKIVENLLTSVHTNILSCFNAVSFYIFLNSNLDGSK